MSDTTYEVGEIVQVDPSVQGQNYIRLTHDKLAKTGGAVHWIIGGSDAE